MKLIAERRVTGFATSLEANRHVSTSAVARTVSP